MYHRHRLQPWAATKAHGLTAGCAGLGPLGTSHDKPYKVGTERHNTDMIGGLLLLSSIIVDYSLLAWVKNNSDDKQLANRPWFTEGYQPYSFSWFLTNHSGVPFSAPLLANHNTV